jgi:hypothetical protein
MFSFDFQQHAAPFSLRAPRIKVLVVPIIVVTAAAVNTRIICTISVTIVIVILSRLPPLDSDHRVPMARVWSTDRTRYNRFEIPKKKKKKSKTPKRRAPTGERFFPTSRS